MHVWKSSPYCRHRNPHWAGFQRLQYYCWVRPLLREWQRSRMWMNLSLRADRSIQEMEMRYCKKKKKSAEKDSALNRREYWSLHNKHWVLWCVPLLYCHFHVHLTDWQPHNTNVVLHPSTVGPGCLDICSHWPFDDLTTYQLWLLHTWSTSASSGNCTGHTASNRSNHFYYTPTEALNSAASK